MYGLFGSFEDNYNFPRTAVMKPRGTERARLAYERCSRRATSTATRSAFARNRSFPRTSVERKIRRRPKRRSTSNSFRPKDRGGSSSIQRNRGKSNRIESNRPFISRISVTLGNYSVDRGERPSGRAADRCQNFTHDRTGESISFFGKHLIKLLFFWPRSAELRRKCGRATRLRASRLSLREIRQEIRCSRYTGRSRDTDSRAFYEPIQD